MRRFRKSMCHSTRDYYKCEVCDYKVYSRTALKLHTKKVHSLDDTSLERIDRQTCGTCGKSMTLHSKKRGNCP